MQTSSSSPAVVFFDVDGTLVGCDGRIPRSAVAAISKLRENGHYAVINTGRSMSLITQEMISGPFDGIIASCGTHIVWRETTLLNRLIDRELISDAASLLLENKIDFWLEGPEHVFVSDLSPDGYIADFLSFFWDTPGILADFRTHELRVNKFTFHVGPQSCLDPCLPLLEKHFQIIRHPDQIETVPIGFSKATGMRCLLDTLALPADRTYAFGDSLNDMEMLSFARYGVAMGGSRDAVVDICDYVTGRPEEDGIANALRHYGLI